MRHLLKGRRLLEGGAYFPVDTQRSSAYYTAALIGDSVLIRGIRYTFQNEPPQVCETVTFSELEWKYHIFWNIKTGKWDLKILLFNCWNYLALGSTETFSGSRYIPVSETNHHSCLIGLFLLNLSENIKFLRYKNGGVRP